MNEERRRFTRVPFDAQTSLHQDGWHVAVQLVDVSLRGLLVMQPSEWDPVRAQSAFVAVIDLSEGNQINMEVNLVHAEGGVLGFKCEHIDLDSISHLKRLLALNLGDSSLLDRELAALLQSDQ